MLHVVLVPHRRTPILGQYRDVGRLKAWMWGRVDQLVLCQHRIHKITTIDIAVAQVPKGAWKEEPSFLGCPYSFRQNRLA